MTEHTGTDIAAMAGQVADAIDAYQLSDRPHSAVSVTRGEDARRGFSPAEVREVLNTVTADLRRLAANPDHEPDANTYSLLRSNGLRLARNWEIYATPLDGPVRQAAMRLAEAIDVRDGVSR